MRKAIIVTKPTSEIDQLIKSKPDYLIGARLALIRLVSNGATLRDAADDLPFLTHSRIGVWVNRFNNLGVEGLKNKPGRGRAPLLSALQLQELKELVLKKLPSEFGYNTATWTGPLLIEIIKKRFHVSIKKATIYVLLKDRLGLSHQKGKGFYPEASLDERQPIVEAIKKNSWK